MPQINPGFTGLAANDQRAIEAQHARLEQLLKDLCDTCSEFNRHADCSLCPREKVACCQGRLPSFLYDFLDLVADHFETEEQIMSQLLQPSEIAYREYLRRHREEHANLMREVKQLIQQSGELSKQGNVGEAIRLFHQLISRRFSEHAHSFDNPLLKPELKMMN
jgi:hypothetical protein